MENKVNVISYVEINTTGNALDFGDITYSGDKGTATSSHQQEESLPGEELQQLNSLNIEFITISSKAIQ